MLQIRTVDHKKRKDIDIPQPEDNSTEAKGARKGSPKNGPGVQKRLRVIYMSTLYASQMILLCYLEAYITFYHPCSVWQAGQSNLQYYSGEHLSLQDYTLK